MIIVLNLTIYKLYQEFPLASTLERGRGEVFKEFSMKCYNINMQNVVIKRVGILRGGAGKDYKSSLQKGGEIILYISENLRDKWKPFDILVDKEGAWHLNGVPIVPLKLLYKVDVVWNLSQQSFSNILESFSVPHIGIPPFSPVFNKSKEMLRKHMKSIGMQMPRSIVLPLYQEDIDGPMDKYIIKKAKEVHNKFPAPWIVKSFTEDTNMGMHLAKTFPELVDAIEDAAKHDKSILVEEFIAGKVASVHSVLHFRNQDIYTFPLGNSFGSFSSDEKEKIATLAKNLHKHLEVKHYLKSDFILTPRGKVYLLSFELIPDLKPDSHFSQVCESVGAKTHHIIDHILERAL